MEQKYSVIFEGKVAPGQRPDQVREKLAAAFKVDAATVAKMFNGQKMVRKELTAEQAARYRKVFESAGAVCRVEPPLQPKPAKYVVKKPETTEEIKTIPLARPAAPEPPPPPAPSYDETPRPQFSAAPSVSSDVEDDIRNSARRQANMIGLGCGGLVVLVGVLTFLFGAVGFRSEGYIVPRFMVFGGLIVVGGAIWLSKIFRDLKEGK
jgi:hypothetical protein